MPPEQRFPLLPPEQPRFDRDARNELTNDSTLTYDHDNFDAARAWLKYAMDPVEDPARKRIPRNLSMPIFQNLAPRAQAYHADYLEKYGWFDEEGWEVNDWFPVDKSRPAGAKKTVTKRATRKAPARKAPARKSPAKTTGAKTTARRTIRKSTARTPARRIAKKA